jgi:predicted Rossmann-fold nucleotide-binding protein
MMPGGFGTMDEFFEVATLIQTGKMCRCHLFCGKTILGRIDVLLEEVMKKENNVSDKDIALLKSGRYS